MAADRQFDTWPPASLDGLPVLTRPSVAVSLTPRRRIERAHDGMPQTPMELVRQLMIIPSRLHDPVMHGEEVYISNLPALWVSIGPMLYRTRMLQDLYPRRTEEEMVGEVYRSVFEKPTTPVESEKAMMLLLRTIYPNAYIYRNALEQTMDDWEELTKAGYIDIKDQQAWYLRASDNGRSLFGDTQWNLVERFLHDERDREIAKHAHSHSDI